MNRGKIAECTCKYDLRRVSAASVERRETMLSYHIYSKLGFTPEMTIDMRGNPLHELDLNRMISLIVFTAGYFRHQSRQQEKFNISKEEITILHPLLVKGYEVYQEWPRNYYKFLEDLRYLQRNVKENTGFRRDFGKYYFLLYKKYAEHQYAFVRSAFEKFIASRWTGGYLRSYSYSKKAAAKAEYVTARQAAEIINIKHQRIPGLVKRGLLEGEIRKMGSKTLCLVAKSSAHRLRNQFKKSLNIIQATRLLGTSTENLKALIISNTVNTLNSPHSDGGGKWKIPQENLDQLLDKLNDRRCIAGPGKADTCKMESAALRLRISTADLVKAVLDEKILPCNEKPARCLKNFEFLKEDLFRYKRDYLLNAKKEELTIEEVRNRIGVKKQGAVYFLIKSKLLRAEKKKCGTISSLLIEQAELDRFNERFVKASDVARSLKTWPRSVVARLKKEGAIPVSGPEIDGGPIYWLRKGDVIRFLYIDQNLFKNGYKNSLVHKTGTESGSSKQIHSSSMRSENTSIDID